MVKKYVIKFRPAESPICAPVTKFGGQPFWLANPQWPLSRATGKPMRFICQIDLQPEVFGSVPARMAYLFMTDPDPDGDWVDGTYKLDGGENALIFQPGQAIVPIAAKTTGPTLYRMADVRGTHRLAPISCEFSTEIVAGDDPAFAPWEVQRKWDKERQAAYDALVPLNENKVGGVPRFLQNDEIPVGEPWRLLLQLDSCSVPFYINFGDAGVGYAFMDHSGAAGKFLWQCG